MKASGSTISLVQGVSQQVPSSRAPGQHTEVVNMLPDPVNGLTRRHGTQMIAEGLLGSDATKYDVLVEDTNTYRTYEITIAGKDYSVMYRSGARPAGSDLPACLVYNRTDQKFLSYVRSPNTDTVLNSLESGGVSALTGVGKYLFLAGNTVVPTSTSFDHMADPEFNTTAALWVRGGAYSRKFQVTVTHVGGTETSFEYKTMAAGYPELLDTSDLSPLVTAEPPSTETTKEKAVWEEDTATPGYFKYNLYYKDFQPTGLSAKIGSTALTVVSSHTPGVDQIGWITGETAIYGNAAMGAKHNVELTYTHQKTETNPAYARQVSLRSEAYNSAATKWISDAAIDQTPANIAAKLKAAAEAAGVTGITIHNSTLIFTNVIGIRVNDGGDNTLLRGVATEVSSVDRFVPIH